MSHQFFYNRRAILLCAHEPSVVLFQLLFKVRPFFLSEATMPWWLDHPLLLVLLQAYSYQTTFRPHIEDSLGEIHAARRSSITPSGAFLGSIQTTSMMSIQTPPNHNKLNQLSVQFSFLKTLTISAFKKKTYLCIMTKYISKNSITRRKLCKDPVNGSLASRHHHTRTYNSKAKPLKLQVSEPTKGHHAIPQASAPQDALETRRTTAVGKQDSTRNNSPRWDNSGENAMYNYLLLGKKRGKEQTYVFCTWCMTHKTSALNKYKY